MAPLARLRPASNLKDDDVPIDPNTMPGLVLPSKNGLILASARAPVVGAKYEDGQYWHEQRFPLPEGTARMRATLYYQSLTRHYIEALRDGNITDDWGDTLHRLWEQTGRGAPLRMTGAQLSLVDSLLTDGFEQPQLAPPGVLERSEPH